MDTTAKRTNPKARMGCDMRTPGHLESKFSFKSHGAMNGAPKFASRWLLHFSSFAGEICTTAAGRASSFIAQLREFSPIRRQSPKEVCRNRMHFLQQSVACP